MKYSGSLAVVRVLPVSALLVALCLFVLYERGRDAACAHVGISSVPPYGAYSV